MLGKIFDKIGKLILNQEKSACSTLLNESQHNGLNGVALLSYFIKRRSLCVDTTLFRQNFKPNKKIIKALTVGLHVLNMLLAVLY